MKRLPETYRTFRRNLTVPAVYALRWLRESEKLAARLAETGFTWQEDRHYHRFACWKEDGFDLRARIVDEVDGWWEHGSDTIGKFISRWQPGGSPARSATVQSDGTNTNGSFRRIRNAATRIIAGPVPMGMTGGTSA